MRRLRLNNIEFRYSECNKSYELVNWENSETCYVVAFFCKHKEGYNMETVGDRFFKDHDAWIVGKHALNFLNKNNS